MTRHIRLKLAALRHIITSDDALLSSAEDVLINDIRDAVSPAAGVFEIAQILRELESDRRIVRVVSDVVRYTPTVRGRAFAMENA